MANSIGTGIGSVGGSGDYRRNAPSFRAEESNPQVGSDGFASSFNSLPATTSNSVLESSPDKVGSAAGDQTEFGKLATTAGAGSSADISRNPITLSFEQGISAIGLAGENATIGLGAFTNGIGKSNITSISGRVLAGNPYGQ